MSFGTPSGSSEAHILGFTVMQLSFPYRGEELAGMATTFLQQLPADATPTSSSTSGSTWSRAKVTKAGSSWGSI